VAGSDTRVGERQPTSMRIKLKYPDLETFIQKYAVNISRGGIFIATKQPKPVGTMLRFEFLLATGDQSIIRGEGQVQWTREFDPAQPTKAHGMGVRFTRLDSESQAVIDRALAFRAQVAERRDAAAPRGDTPPVPVGAQPSAPIVESGPTRLDPPSGPTRYDGGSGSMPVPVDAVALNTAPPIASGPSLIPDDSPTQPGTPRDELDANAALAAGGATDVNAGREGPTRPIAIADGPAPDSRPISLTGRPPNVETKPIRLDLGGANGHGARGDDLDALAAEWGLSEERLARALKRSRPRMVEATAELERLLRKPPRPATPTKAEALSRLTELLARDPKRR
jgi:molecular chaperone DnaK